MELWLFIDIVFLDNTDITEETSYGYKLYSHISKGKPIACISVTLKCCSSTLKSFLKLQKKDQTVVYQFENNLSLTSKKAKNVCLPVNQLCSLYECFIFLMLHFRSFCIFKFKVHPQITLEIPFKSNLFAGGTINIHFEVIFFQMSYM